MLKIIGSAMLILSSGLLGNWFSIKLSKRSAFLTDILEGISRMKTMICFGGYDVSRVLLMSFPQLFKEDIEIHSNITEIWNEQIDKIPKNMGLLSEDKAVLKDFGRGIGITDTQGQINNCELYEKLISERLTQSKNDEASKSRLYRILGFSLGCVLTLLVL